MTALSASSLQEALPDFEKPPVIEVALAVGFQHLPGLRIVDIGHLWDRFKEAFPKVSEQPQIEMPVEQFGVAAAAPQVSFQLMNTPPPARVWFSDEDESNLIQIQANWFARNWKKTSSEGGYPRYPALRDQFERDFSAFLDYTVDRGLGEFRPSQCEVTYINHIPGTGGVTDLGEVLTLLPSKPLGGLPHPESVRIAAQYLLGDPPIGRLHVSAEPATRRLDGQRITVLTLTARGAPMAVNLDGVLAFLDLGHREVVRAFDTLTTEQMHTIWGKVTGATKGATT